MTSKVVTFVVTNPNLQPNSNAKVDGDIALTIRGNIVKDGKPSKSGILRFTVGQVRRDGFAIAEKNGVVTIKAREFSKGRRIKESAKVSDVAAFLTKLAK